MTPAAYRNPPLNQKKSWLAESEIILQTGFLHFTKWFLRLAATSHKFHFAFTLYLEDIVISPHKHMKPESDKM